MKKYIITLLFCTLFCHLGIAQGLKSVSILGDSYSTFEGYVQPDTNFVWYLKTPPEGRKTDMVSVRNTWWHQFIKENKEQLVEGNWMNIQPWSTEDPNLYVARLELKDPEGKTVQSRETRIGFRTIEFFPQDGVYLNGTKLVVKGVNRHSFSVDGGRATSAGEGVYEFPA
jgi:hypothetical protein